MELNPNITITTTGAGGAGIFALAGGMVTANGITIATSGLLAPDGFNADGAAALGGTITLENSSISTSGDNASRAEICDKQRPASGREVVKSKQDFFNFLCCA